MQAPRPVEASNGGDEQGRAAVAGNGRGLGARRAGVPLERGVCCTYLLFVTDLVAFTYLQSSGPRSRF